MEILSTVITIVFVVYCIVSITKLNNKVKVQGEILNLLASEKVKTLIEEILGVTKSVPKNKSRKTVKK